MGYFPESVLERIEQVRSLKAEGLSMAEIAARFGSRTQGTDVRTGDSNIGNIGATASAAQDVRSMPLSLDDVAHPAYMVNYNFELTWYNEAARKELLGFKTPPPGSESRNIFLMLTDACVPGAEERRNQLLRLHVSFAKARLSKTSVEGLLKNVEPREAVLIGEMYDECDTTNGVTIMDFPYNLRSASGEVSSWQAYGIFFREGILLVHVPAEQAEPGLLQFLARRDVVIRNLLKKRLPVLTPLAVMVTDLQSSVKICSELPPEEYFELINEIWAAMAPIFRKYYGTHGKHVGDGMVYYFFPQPDSHYIFNAMACAYEIRQEMRKISKAWQLRKNWLNELYLNTGLHEGQEWLGTFQTATSVEFAVLGDTINHCARLGDFARFGAIWATKKFVSQLTPEDRARVEFGITRRSEEGDDRFVISSYSQLSSLLDLQSERYEKLRDIANLPITEIREVRLN